VPERGAYVLEILKDAIGTFFDPDHWTRFVAAFGNPVLAVIAVGILSVTFLFLVGMIIWWSLALRRMKLAAETALQQLNIDVTREVRILGIPIYQRTIRRVP
jgi:hypothetical protein